MKKYELVKNMMRSIFAAPEGKAIFCADFASVEARIVLWMGGEEEAIQMLNDGVDIYVEMAKNIDTKNPDRQLGKQVILGCFANAMIPTKNRVSHILDIKSGDLVWNGDKWVSHNKVKFQGYKHVEYFEGLMSTSDHLFAFGEKDWGALWWLKENTEYLKKVKEWGIWKSSDTFGVKGVDSCPIARDVHATLRSSTIHTLLILEKLRIADYVDGRNPESHNQNLEDTTLSSRMLQTAKDGVIDTPQSCQDVTLILQRLINIMGDEESLLSLLGTIEKHFSEILYKNQDGKTLLWSLIGSTIMGIIQMRIQGLLPDLETSEIHEDLYRSVTTVLDMVVMNLEISSAPKCSILAQSVAGVKKAWTGKIWSDIMLPVFDLINVEDGNRFEVCVGESTIVAHNCGFGMGPKTFMTTCQSYKMDVSKYLAERSIKAYRDKYAGVKRAWYAFGTAFESAMRTGEGEVSGVQFRKEIIFNREAVTMQFFSGRKMTFWEPSYCAGKYGPAIQYRKKIAGNAMVMSQTWGGDIFQSFVQGTARDLMVLGARKAQEAGFDIFATVHDEAIALGDKDRDEEEFRKAFSHIPDWAEGCPIDSSVWKGYFYRKD